MCVLISGRHVNNDVGLTARTARDPCKRHFPDHRHELRNVERFPHDAVDKVCREPSDGCVIAGGHDENDRTRLGLRFVEGLEKLDAVDQGHHEIEQDDRILRCPRHVQRFGAIHRGMNIERLAAQRGHEQRTNSVVILDHQDLRNCGHYSSPACGFGASTPTFKARPGCCSRSNVVRFEKAPPEARQLLTVPIRELGLRLEQSPVAEYVHRLYDELAAAGLRHFRPVCYLSDQWGCPSEEPVIGIPFYLGDPRVAHIEAAVNDVENEREIMMYLRHEAGHAFNYAYELYRTAEWHDLFGSFRRRYRDDYPFVPFSRDYVRHIAGWYAQKHPDEDCAETFAVWLDPESHWRQRYANWGATRKLLYIDRVAREVSDMPPPHVGGQTDVTVDEMEQTLEQFYHDDHADESAMIAGLPLDTDLADIFLDPARRRESVDYRAAEELLSEHRRDIIDKVNEWTGVRRTLVRALVSAVEQRLRELGLLAQRDQNRSQMIELTVYITTLSMTFLTGKRPLRHRKTP